MPKEVKATNVVKEVKAAKTKVTVAKKDKVAKVEKPAGKRGRPVVEGSPRQIRLAEAAARVKANGGVVKRGRAVNATSARQVRLAEAAANAEAGIVVKRGRKPKDGAKVAKVKKVKVAKVDPNIRFAVKNGEVVPVSKFSKGVKFATEAEAKASLVNAEVEA